MIKERCECHDCTQARLTMLLKEGIPARSQYSGPMPMMPPPKASYDFVPNNINAQQEEINRAMLNLR